MDHLATAFLVQGGKAVRMEQYQPSQPTVQLDLIVLLAKGNALLVPPVSTYSYDVLAGMLCKN